MAKQEAEQKIKSVRFKDAHTEHLRVGERLIKRDDITVPVFMSLVAQDPKLAENFTVEFEKASKKEDGKQNDKPQNEDTNGKAN